MTEDERRAMKLMRGGMVGRRPSEIVEGFDFQMLGAEQFLVQGIKLVLSDGSEYFVHRPTSKGVLEWIHLLLEEMLRDGKIKSKREKHRRKR